MHSNFPTLHNCFPGNCRSLLFTTFPKPGFRLENHTLRTIEVVNEDLCRFQCYLEPNCVSYNFCEIKQLSGKHECDLNNATIEHDEDLVKNESYIYRGAEVRILFVRESSDTKSRDIPASPTNLNNPLATGITITRTSTYITNNLA